MAVAVKSSPETLVSRALNRVAVGSLAGTAYTLATLVVVFYLFPALWHQILSPLISSGSDSPVDASLLWLVNLGVFAGLVYSGLRLLGPHPSPGVRAGIAVGVLGFYALVLIALGIGQVLERSLSSVPAVGAIVTVVIGLTLLGLAASLYLRTGFENWLIQFEEQGWFSMSSYKRTQGMRIRRGTMLAIMLLTGCGIYSILARDTLRTASSDAWRVSIPFTHGTSLTILGDLQFTVPILLAALSLWFAYRLVNYPGFADFLIATEAEMNKVSWVTRRRLYQDTIVVLTTVVLLTAFMFVVDLAWVWFLESPPIRVLQTPSADLGKTVGPQGW
jgi:preprotein translocase SecE subunit